MVRPSSAQTVTLATSPMPSPPYSLRHVIAGKPQLLGLGVQMRAHLGLELVAVARGPLDRDHLPVDELADGVLEHPDFFRKLEVQARCGHPAGDVVHPSHSLLAERRMRRASRRSFLFGMFTSRSRLSKPVRYYPGGVGVRDF